MKKSLWILPLLMVAIGGRATGPSAAPSATPFPARLGIVRPHNDLLSARRALEAAKAFLAKSPADPAGHRAKAQQALESVLTEVNAAVAEEGLGQR